MTINERFGKIIRVLYGGNKSAFASAIGVTPSVVDNIVGKRQGKPSFEVVEKVSSIAEVNITWLVTGEGNAFDFSKKQNAENTSPITHTDDPTQGIPLIPVEAMAGALSELNQTIMEYQCDHYVIPMFKGAEFLIQVKGDSMLPKYYSGDIVACKRLPLDTFFQWNRTYVIDSEQGALIKKIKPGKDDKHITLVSENPEYEPFELDREQIYSLALVIGVVRAE